MVSNAEANVANAWQALAVHYEQIRHLHLRQLFAEDAERAAVEQIANRYVEWVRTFGDARGG
jgi:hypothetical protein